MPTFDVLARFLDDYRRLTAEQREAFLRARDALVDDLRTGRGFRPGLRIKRVQSTTDVWELTWAPDGRVTWQYGTEQVPGEPHVVWRRIGTHAIFRNHDEVARSGVCSFVPCVATVIGRPAQHELGRRYGRCPALIRW